MQTPQLWRDLHAGRWNWAERALEAYRSDTPDFLRPLLRRGALETSVVLYGHTQMGKTTLILTLMGLREGTEFDRVSEVLRGARQIGKSATILPTRYRPVPRSDGWSFRWGGQHLTGLDDAEMEAALVQARASSSVTGGVAGPESVAEIGVPIRGDTLGADSLLHVLDLPGEAPSSSDEARVVRQIADHFVPRAEVVILVARAEDPTALRPGSLQHIPVLSYWPQQAHRYRVVLTNTASMESEATWLKERASQPATAEWRERITNAVVDDILRGYLPLEGTVQDLRLAVSNAIFPVEFGDSWAKFRRADPEGFARAEPLVSDVIAELARTLSPPERDGATLVAALRWPQDLSLGIQRRRAARSLELSRLASESADQNRRLEDVLRRASATEAEQDRLVARLMAIETLHASLSQSKVSPPPVTIGKDPKPKSAMTESLEMGGRIAHATAQLWDSLIESFLENPTLRDDMSLRARFQQPASLVTDCERQANITIDCCKSAANAVMTRGCTGSKCRSRLLSRLPQAVEAANSVLKSQMTDLIDASRAEVEAELTVVEAMAGALVFDEAHLRHRLEGVLGRWQQVAETDASLSEAEGDAVREVEQLSTRLRQAWSDGLRDLNSHRMASATSEDRAIIQLAILGHYRAWERIDAP